MTTTACLPECRCVCPDLYEGHRPSGHAGSEYEHHAPGCPNGPRAPQAECYHCKTCREQCAPRTGQPICCNCKSPLTAPQAEDGGKVETWDNTTMCFGNDCPNCKRERKKKPAPSEQPRMAAGDGPKQGSEEPVDFAAAGNYANSEWWKLKPPATVCDEREGNLARAYLARGAELAAADQNLKTMLQTAGDEAARQLAEKDKRIEALETELSLAVVPDDHEAEERAVLQAELAAAREEVSAEKDRADKAEQRVRELEAQL